MHVRVKLVETGTWKERQKRHFELEVPVIALVSSSLLIQTESDIILMLFIDVSYTEFMHSHVALLG